MKRWQARLVAGGFLAVCWGYFAICRRLSLATQWVFLCGFVGATPFLLLSRQQANRKRPHLVIEFALTVMAYIAFHYTAVAFLSQKYTLSSF